MASLTWLENGGPRFAQFAPGQVTVLGRNEEADIIIDSPDKTISRKHARVVARNGSYTVENLSATNITRVNGVAIAAPAALDDKALLQLGTTTLTFHDISRSVILSGLICDNCKRENPAAQKDCWFCGQNLVNAQSVALRNRSSACRIVAPVGPVVDVFIGRSAGIRADGVVEPVRAGQPYSARLEASGENTVTVFEGESNELLAEQRTIHVNGRVYVLLLP